MKKSAEYSLQNVKSNKSCEDPCRSHPSLPHGIVTTTSDLEMRPLWGQLAASQTAKNLLAISAGIKQKENVNKMVSKVHSNELI